MPLRRLCFAVVSAFAFAAVAHAADLARNTDAAAILAQQQSIRAEVEARAGRYAELHPRTRDRLFGKQDEVARLLEGRGSVLDLPEVDRIRVFNALETISAIINGDENERMVCRRTKPVGTNRTTTVCKTVGELREEASKVEGDTGRRTLQCSEATMGPGGCRN